MLFYTPFMANDFSFTFKVNLGGKKLFLLYLSDTYTSAPKMLTVLENKDIC
jgi:hypothetical protein